MLSFPEEDAVEYLFTMPLTVFKLRIKSTYVTYHDTKGDGPCGYRAVWQTPSISGSDFSVSLKMNYLS